MEKRQKKVTIKHYLNKRTNMANMLSDKDIEYYLSLGVAYETLQERYPVYTRVTFNRQTNIFALNWGEVFKDGLNEEQFENYFEKGTSPGILKEIQRKDRVIENSIRYEYQIHGDDFTLKGFSDKLRLYERILTRVVSDHVFSGILSTLEAHLTVSQYKRFARFPSGEPIGELAAVLGGIEEVVPDLVDIIGSDLKLKLRTYVWLWHFFGDQRSTIRFVIDWLYGGGKGVFEEKLTSFLKKNSEEDFPIPELPQKYGLPLRETSVPQMLNFVDEIVTKGQ